jgi:arylformamidase
MMPQGARRPEQVFVELGYEFSEDMPVFPGLPPDRVLPHSRMSDGAESNTTMLHHFIHNGTHVDAPFHFWDGGRTIDQIPLEDFVYEHPALLMRELAKGQLFERRDIESAGVSLEGCDLLMLCSGYWKLRERPEIYCDDFPALSVEAARFVRLELPTVKAVAVDTLSVENPVQGPKSNFMVHRTLLNGDLYQSRPVLAFEDVNLGPLVGRRVRRVYAFPLRWRGLDGSPVNPVAEVG